MLLYLLFIKALKHVIITVDKDSPLNFNKSPTSLSDWYLYKIITICMHKYESDNRFISTIGVIKSNFEQKKINSKNKPSTMELKILLVIYVLCTFQLGNFIWPCLIFRHYMILIKPIIIVLFAIIARYIFKTLS